MSIDNIFNIKFNISIKCSCSININIKFNNMYNSKIIILFIIYQFNIIINIIILFIIDINFCCLVYFSYDKGTNFCLNFPNLL